MSIGKVREFVIKSGNWSLYVERLEMYFKVNKVEDDLKLPTLISFMGEEAYELLSTLASPLKPSDLSYSRAVEILAAHLQPKPSILAERYKFRLRRQLTHESIADYVTELKKLAKYCEFKSTLDDNLRDQLVCGLKSEMIRQKLFAEENLPYNKAVSLALSLEAAERDASAVEPGNGEAAEVHKLNLDSCPRCSGKHKSSDCPFKDYVCSGCGETGHLRRVCQRIVRREGSAGSAGGGGWYGSSSYSYG